ncbi:hypothetical protein ACFWOB_38990 [Streptomyces sp. NPDC058420]|uniref:hypothetical protein n=1 Tax=Streptomyces sp. NPDC058420 TaxID=3346489 RepID=UPI00364ACB72
MSTDLARTAANRSSKRLAAAHRRKTYTGERVEAALAGIGRKNDIGLDACSPVQRSFRAFFALGLFNDGPAGARPGAWGYTRLSAYDPVVSPRWDELVVIAERAPDNVVGWLVPKQNRGMLCVPGLRLAAMSTRDWGTFYLRHEPTGARLVVTGRRAGPLRDDERRSGSWRDALLEGEPLSGAERRAMGSVPSMTPDAEVLLAGLVTRYAMEDRREKWATSWSWDPLDRSGDRRQDADLMSRNVERRLWGEGDSWELRWTGYPYPADLARALTHPVVGIPGAALHLHRDIFEVTYGSALLEIREWRA